jgi:hypothetical protein
MPVVKKHIAIILILLATLMLILVVIWLFQKRIENIERRINPAVAKVYTI